MKNLLTLSIFVFMTSLSAQETGGGSISATKASQAPEWQNWTIAAGSLVAATIGVIVVATNDGSASNHH